MNILLAHNFYGSSSPSGENEVFGAEKLLLESHGHFVSEFTRNSDLIRNQGLWGLIKGGFSTPWNPWMHHAIKKSVESMAFDVVHVHNVFPLISPSIFSAIGKKAARVLTLHNYRLFCAAAIPMRDGKSCTDCISSKTILPALRYGCYRKSRIATAPLALGIALHRGLGTWGKNVDAFIALSEFQKSLLIDAGLPAYKIFVKPNFFPGNPMVVPWAKRGNYVVFAGRLSAEKGIISLIEAWKRWANAPELRVIGDGPLRGELEKLANGLNIKFIGQISQADVLEQIAFARLMVLPSRWFEGFPMVIREAFAHGTPVAAANIGPLPSIVINNENGVLINSFNTDDMATVLISSWENTGLLERLGQGARQAFENLYTEEQNYRILMKIYEQAIDINQQDR